MYYRIISCQTESLNIDTYSESRCTPLLSSVTVLHRTHSSEKFSQRMVYRLFMQWLEQLLPPCQAGFRMIRSTEEQVNTLYEKVTNDWNNRRQMIAVFSDFSTAYDRVQYYDLMVRLGHMECPTFLWCWIDLVLDRCWRQCRWDNAISSERV